VRKTGGFLAAASNRPISTGIRQKIRPEIIFTLPATLRLFCRQHGPRLVFDSHQGLGVGQN